MPSIKYSSNLILHSLPWLSCSFSEHKRGMGHILIFYNVCDIKGTALSSICRNNWEHSTWPISSLTPVLEAFQDFQQVLQRALELPTPACCSGDTTVHTSQGRPFLDGTQHFPFSLTLSIRSKFCPYTDLQSPYSGHTSPFILSISPCRPAPLEYIW